MKLTYEINSREISADLIRSGSGRAYQILMEGKPVVVEILRASEGKLELLIDGRHVSAHVSSDNTRRWVTVNGRTLVLNKSTGGRKAGSGQHHAAGELTAPMPGQVRAVNVQEGDTVTKGQTLLLLEAMKMEIRIQSPRDGLVKKLSVQQGQTVEREQLLVEIEEQSPQL
jgi:biotin carboxyl carrier protein